VVVIVGVEADVVDNFHDAFWPTNFAFILYKCSASWAASRATLAKAHVAVRAVQTRQEEHLRRPLYAAVTHQRLASVGQAVPNIAQGHGFAFMRQRSRVSAADGTDSATVLQRLLYQLPWQ